MKMFKWIFSLFRRLSDWMRGTDPVQEKTEKFVEQLTEKQEKQIRKQQKRNAARRREARFKPDLVWVGSACREFGINRDDFCDACGVPRGTRYVSAYLLQDPFIKESINELVAEAQRGTVNMHEVKAGRTSDV